MFVAEKVRYLTMTDSDKVWMPDTFFRNEKIGRFHKILQPNLYVRVFPNGDVLYSIRVSLTCACSMQLHLFPLDKQTCNLDVASCKCIRITFLSLNEGPHLGAIHKGRPLKIGTF